MAGTHSLWSPSGAKRWRKCLGSPVMNDGAPDSTSIYAAEGTAYHKLAEDTFRKRPSDVGGHCVEYVGTTREADGFKFKITEEDADYAQVYVDRLRARHNAGCIVQLEVKTDTSVVLGIPDQSGTVDAESLDIANKTLELNDLKFGKGVKVYLYELGDEPIWQRVNDQVGIYGASELERLSYVCDWQFLKLSIHQPRIDHYAEVTLTRAEVDEFVRAVKADAQRSYQTWLRFREDATGLISHLTPSMDACRWCVRAGSCRARNSHLLETYRLMSAKNLPLLTALELATTLDKLDEIEAWTRAVRAEALSRIEQKSADRPPGWKTVEGRKGDRTMDETAALARIRNVLSENAYPDVIPDALYTEPELKTVAQIEKAVKKLGAVGKLIWSAISGDPEKGIGSLITQAPGRPQLVRDFDERPELAPQAVSFELRPVGQEFEAQQRDMQAGGIGAAKGLL